MLKLFTAQNFNEETYTVLDFTSENRFLYLSKGGDISSLKRFIQLLWASTTEDGIGLTFQLKNKDHTITSTTENIYYDDIPVKIGDLEKTFNIKFTDYSKLFVITYTQLLNMELGRVPAIKYLSKYAFTKPESKSYYSPVEDIFYDIEQSKRYQNVSEDPTFESEDKEKKIAELKDKIKNLEEVKEKGLPELKENPDNKITEIEEKLENQKKQDVLIGEKENINRDLTLLSQKIRQYEDALGKISKYDENMVKYSKYMQINPKSLEDDLAMFAYRIREREKMISDITAHRKIAIYETNTSQIAVLPILVLLTVSVFVGVTLSVIANVFLGLAIDFILVVSIMMYFLFTKDLKPEDSGAVSPERYNAMLTEIEALKIAKSRYLHNLGFNTEDDYYATKALVRAMVFQKESELSKLHQTFENKEISDFRTEYEHKKNSLLDLQIEIDKLGPTMSAEEYIKLRRQLDILKLEKSSQSNEVDEKYDIDAQLTDLNNQLSELLGTTSTVNAKEVFENIMKEYYGTTDLNVSDDYITNGIEVNTYEQKVELMIIQRIAYLKAVYPDVELPFFMEDPFAGVENSALITKILEFCSSRLQIIFISEHDKYKENGLKVINELS